LAGFSSAGLLPRRLSNCAINLSGWHTAQACTGE
jgi:hypothetical protein